MLNPKYFIENGPRKNNNLITVVVSFMILLYSCFPVTTTTNTKRPSSGAIYNPFIQQLHPEFFIFHLNKQKTRLYLKLNLSELMFAPMGTNKSYQSKIKIEYKIFQFDKPENLVDSSSVIFEIKKRKGETSAVTYLNLPDTELDKYYIHLVTTDLLKLSKAEEYKLVEKEHPGSSQNFMVNIKSMNYPYFNKFFNKEDTFRIQYNMLSDSIFIRYFGTKMPLPYPPYSTMARGDLYTYSDSTWSVSGKSEFGFAQNKQGLYFFQPDTTIKAGLALYNFGETFPYIKTTENLIYPLEYLTSTGEFNQLLLSNNKKLSIDKFWLSCGKNTNRARELIRIYYNRTFYANVYFTSFNEGWRTDRGMIYMIFGPPKTVKKSPGKEIWQYSDKLNSKILQFVFNQISNPFTDNDFVLERNYDFQAFWSKATDSWRQGKVYNLFE